MNSINTIVKPLNVLNEQVDNVYPMTRESGNLTMMQFYELFTKVVELERPDIIVAPAWPDMLQPDKDEYKATMANPTKLFKPTITYMVIRQEPGNVGGDRQPFGTGRRDRIPRLREHVMVNNTPVSIYAQWLDTNIRFDLWTLTNREAEDLALWFQRFMITHRMFFKNMGLSEMLFQWRGVDSVSFELRNGLQVRSFIYFFRFEELMYEEESKLNELRIQVESWMRNKNQGG